MKKLLNSLINQGVKTDYQPWEKHLTRKLNSIALLTLLNMVCAISFFLIFNYPDFILDCTLGVFAAMIVIVMNAKKGYTWAAYWFFCYGFWFFIPVNLKMGSQSFIIMFYFPVIISMVQMLGRKEMLKHLIFLSGACLLSIIIIAIGFKLNWYHIVLSDEAISNLAIFNIVLSFITTMAYIITIVSESLNQENLISKMLAEKEILLAEVFHRVKNNMNIVTSLLNLKKNMADSPEVKNALEECRGRVFAMALVHDTIFNKSNITSLNFKDYINNLVNEIANSFGDDETAEINLQTENVYLGLSYAIPCGLILNELITNAFKYAQSEDKRLKIDVKLVHQKNTIELEVRDNGKGFPEEGIKNTESLGLELIKSLSDQIGGIYHFNSNKGLVFNLKFKPTV